MKKAKVKDETIEDNSYLEPLPEDDLNSEPIDVYDATATRPLHWRQKRKQRENARTKKVGVTRVFFANAEAGEKIIINRGGARSSKSYSIAQLLIHKFFTLPGIKILVTRKSMPSLKRSNYRTMCEIIESYGLKDRILENKTEMTWRYRTSILQFVSVDNEEKIKSTEWNIIWMEEATEFSWDEYITLLTRLSGAPVGEERNQLFLSFNPVDEHCWIKEKLIDLLDPDILEIHSSWRDNPFLTDDYIEVLMSLEKQDPNYYRIYALGEWGKLENLIFNNWYVSEEYPDTDQICFGLDFGYNQASTLVELRWWKNILWVRQRIYEVKLTNQDLIRKMKEEMTEEEKSYRMIYADSAEPDRIEEILRAGFRCVAADKAVVPGIDWMKAAPINIHPSSEETLKEIRGYSWKTDKDGHVLDEPVKFNDHAMNAARYGSYTHWGKGGTFRPRIRSL